MNNGPIRVSSEVGQTTGRPTAPLCDLVLCKPGRVFGMKLHEIIPPDTYYSSSLAMIKGE